MHEKITSINIKFKLKTGILKSSAVQMPQNSYIFTSRISWAKKFYFFKIFILYFHINY